MKRIALPLVVFVVALSGCQSSAEYWESIDDQRGFRIDTGAEGVHDSRFAIFADDASQGRIDYDDGSVFFFRADDPAPSSYDAPSVINLGDSTGLSYGNPADVVDVEVDGELWRFTSESPEAMGEFINNAKIEVSA